MNPYAYYSWLKPPPISPEALNLNPPVSVYVFDPLSRLDPEAVRLSFLAGSIVIFAISVGALLVAYPQRRTVTTLLAVLSLAGLWHMLWYLQIYAPLILGVTASWLLIRKGSFLPAAILLGAVVALKPNYAIVPVLMLAAGHRRLALPAAATALVISAVPLLLDGPRLYLDWLDLSRTFEGLTWASNASLLSVGARFGMPAAGTALAAALFAVVLYWQWRLRPAPLDSLAAALMTAVLLGPVSWAGYTLLLLPYFFARRWDRTTWAALLLLDKPFSLAGISAALGFLANDGLIPSGGGISLPWLRVAAPMMASAYAWAIIVLLAALMIEKARASARTPSRSEPPPEMIETLSAALTPSGRQLRAEPAVAQAAD